MATIIAGEFATTAESDAAVAALKAARFDPANIFVFLLNPPGQHALYPIGGDEDADRGASHAHNGAVSGALIGATVGLGVGAAAAAASATGPAVGASVAATVAAAGAYAGSLVGALNKVGDDEAPAASEGTRHAGVMVAVNAPSATAKNRAIAVLKAHGAKQIEQAEGRWENGKWLDFDPRVTPNLIDSDKPARAPRAANRAAH